MRIGYAATALGLGIAMAWGFSSPSSAATIIGAVGATVSSTFSGDYDIGNAIDQSGLTAGYTSGVDDFGAYIAGGPLHSQRAVDIEWFSQSHANAVTADFDLGAVFSLTGLAIWNEESGGAPTADVSVSTDGLAYVLIATIVPTDNPQGAPYAADVFGFGLALARYVRLEISGCPAPTGLFSGCSLGEIAFRSDAPVSPIPLPASLPLFAGGIGAFGFWGWRKRRKSRARPL